MCRRLLRPGRDPGQQGILRDSRAAPYAHYWDSPVLCPSIGECAAPASISAASVGRSIKRSKPSAFISLCLRFEIWLPAAGLCGFELLAFLSRITDGKRLQRRAISPYRDFRGVARLRNNPKHRPSSLSIQRSQIVSLVGLAKRLSRETNCFARPNAGALVGGCWNQARSGPRASPPLGSESAHSPARPAAD